MNTYISLLRGINVSGKNKIQMQSLAELYALLGFEKIVTYIQSGNVVFTSKLKTSLKIASLIETGIKEKFGFDIPAIVLEKEELSKVFSSNPFLKLKGIDTSKLHITLLAALPAKENLKKIVSDESDNDKMVIAGKVVYLYCPKGYGKTKFTNTFFENKLKVKATTRNLKTFSALIELCSTVK